MADDIFGGVIIERPETQLIVQIGTLGQGNAGVSGFSGYSGATGGSGTGPGSGFSSFSGYSGKSGFSAFSGRSGYSGFSGVGQSGFSGYSGLSGQSGLAGGQSGYSGYSGLDGTFSASGFSGYSGFSSRSGFSGYSGSGLSGYSAYSGFSGTSFSGFSGFSGPGESGFSGYSSFSGFSGKSGYSGPSGISGFSGIGSPPGGSTGDFQYNSGTGTFLGHPSLNVSGVEIIANTNAFRIADAGDPSRKLSINVSNIPSSATRTLLIPNSTNPVAVGADTGATNQFVTGVTALGVITKAQPDFGNLSGLATFAQLDRSTVTVAETSIITLAVNTKTKSTCSGVLTTIAFSGGANMAQARRLDLDVTGGPYTLTIPACRRLGETGSITSLQVFAGYQEFNWEFINGEYILSDSVSTPGAGTSGFSGYSGGAGAAGTAGASGQSGYSGATGASGFSGFSGAGSSGFSGYSAPNLLSFTTHNDTDYTLTLADANTGVKMASTSTHTLTVPTNASVPFVLGTQIPVEQGDTGIVTIAAAGGVTLQGATHTEGIYSVVVLIKQATDTWLCARSGASGYSGFSGSPGTIGVDGSSGFSGFSGAGFSGFSGFSGKSGYSGFSSSVAGASGFSGYSGFSGAGSSGFSGFSGAGLSGFSGFSGISGLSGYSAFSGFSGKSGYSGYSGSGFSGYSGIGADGISGFSGYSSFSGYSGYSAFSGFSGPSLLTFTTKTDTDYTLILGDANTGIKMSSSSAHNLTVPPNSSVAFATGTQIPIEQAGTGLVTIVAGAGVTLQGATVTAGQYSVLVLIKQAADQWLVASGNSGYSGYSGQSGYSGYSSYSGYSAFSGFSGTGGWTRFFVSGSDATNATTSLADITGLVTGTLTASTQYEIHALLRVLTSADTNGTQYAVHGGGTGAAATVHALISGPTSGNVTQLLLINGIDTGSASFMISSGSTGVIEITGFVTTRSTGTPTISIQHLKPTSGTSTVKIGSYFEYRAA